MLWRHERTQRGSGVARDAQSCNTPWEFFWILLGEIPRINPKTKHRDWVARDVSDPGLRAYFLASVSARGARNFATCCYRLRLRERVRLGMEPGKFMGFAQERNDNSLMAGKKHESDASLRWNTGS